MNITGTTNTCININDSQFSKSGLTENFASTISIIDNNGIDVSKCYNITPKITTLDGIIPSGVTCNTLLEIKVDEVPSGKTQCLFTGTTKQSDGLILANYSGGTTTLNIHPDCCISLGFKPEIGINHYYVCRWKKAFDPNDCNNYEPTSIVDKNSYVVFNISSGGTTTIVPLPECCHKNGFSDSLTNGGYHCFDDKIRGCDGLKVYKAPAFGDISFKSSNGVITTIVKTSECCQINGFNFRPVANGFVCYNSLNQIKPKVTISMAVNCCKSSALINNGGVINKNYDGTYYHYILTPCNQALANIRVKSSDKITDNYVHSVFSNNKGINYNGKILSIDLDLSNTVFIAGIGQTINCGDKNIL